MPRLGGPFELVDRTRSATVSPKVHPYCKDMQRSLSILSEGRGFRKGRVVTEKDFLGQCAWPQLVLALQRYLLIYFGFTFCPDICPQASHAS